MKQNSKKAPKPRDPFVQHIVGRKQGAHTKPFKVNRRDEKAALKKECFGRVVF